MSSPRGQLMINQLKWQIKGKVDQTNINLVTIPHQLTRSQCNTRHHHRLPQLKEYAGDGVISILGDIKVRVFDHISKPDNKDFNITQFDRYLTFEQIRYIFLIGNLLQHIILLRFLKHLVNWFDSVANHEGILWWKIDNLLDYLIGLYVKLEHHHID